MELWVQEADCPAIWAHSDLSEPVTDCRKGCLKIGEHERLSPRLCGWQTLRLCCTSCMSTGTFLIGTASTEGAKMLVIMFASPLPYWFTTPWLLDSSSFETAAFLDICSLLLATCEQGVQIFWSRQPDFKFYYPEIGDFWHPVPWGWQLYLNLGLMQNISSWTVHR